MDFDQECFNDFVEESIENLDMLDDAFVTIEKDPENVAELDNIFRAVHTMKGGCRLIGIPRLEKVAHTGENLLDLAREKTIILSSQHISLLLKTIDVLRYFVECIRLNGTEPEGDFSPLITQLEEASEGGVFDPALLDIETMKSGTEIIQKGASPEEESPAEKKVEPEEVSPKVKVEAEEVDWTEGLTVPAALPETPPPAPVSAVEMVEVKKEVAPLPQQEIQLPKVAAEEPIAKMVEKTKKHLPAMSVADPDKKEQAVLSAGAAESTVRIDVKRLDKLMDLVGELVLSRNQLKQINGSLGDAVLNGTTNAISLITSELQEEIVKSRLQPISTVVGKFQRTVRDMAISLNKQVELELRGMGTELDRNLLESIKDPLTHLIRNSLDHGIESPQVREAKGKPAQGTIYIHCFHDGGQVVINIKDDGAGLDPVKIGQKALSRKLVTQDRLNEMSPREIYRFIFNPGFSTAEQVTNISGRGVGMDVVHTNITSIGGQIDVDSVVGKETTIRLQIPLTLAIIPALMVRVDERYFAIPQSSLQELIFLDRDDRVKIESFDGTEVYRLRGQLLPLLRLRPMMNIPEKDSDYFYIVVLVSGEQKFGLIVDEVDDTEEIVVKPLAKFFNSVRFFSGATILGDGSISLILDVEAVAKSANINSIESSHSKSVSISRTKAASTALLFNLGGEETFGIQMSQIARLEEINLSDIEWSGSQEVIQYRGEIMPVIRLSRELEVEENHGDSDKVSLIVFEIKGRETGLIVKDIVDAMPLEGDLDTTVIDHPLILGTMMIKGHIVLMVDAHKAFELSFPKWMGAPRQGFGALPESSRKRVLYVDDSTFYLKVVGRYLDDAGYDVDVAMDGLKGLEKIRKNQYDLLVVDYEMPNMDGLAMIELVRELPQYDLVPIIVLTALTGGKEKFTLINSGIQSYLVKLNKEQLLSEIEKLLEMEAVEV